MSACQHPCLSKHPCRSRVDFISLSLYELAGCDLSNAFFCFPCHLFQSPGTETLWTTTGVRDLKHLSEKCKQHESSRSHLDKSMKLNLFGRVSITGQLDEGYRIGIRKHNEEDVTVKCCGAFELALCGHEETESSDNPGIFRGLVDLVASLDDHCWGWEMLFHFEKCQMFSEEHNDPREVITKLHCSCKREFVLFTDCVLWPVHSRKSLSMYYTRSNLCVFFHLRYLIFHHCWSVICVPPKKNFYHQLPLLRTRTEKHSSNLSEHISTQLFPCLKNPVLQVMHCTLWRPKQDWQLKWQRSHTRPSFSSP